MQQETAISNEIKPAYQRSLFDLAETMQFNALNGARRKLLPGYKDETLSVLLERPDFIHYFKYALIHEVTDAITAYDFSVEAVYLYGLIDNPTAVRDFSPAVTGVSIQLIAVAETASGNLKNYAAALNRTISIILTELPWTTPSGRNSFLEIVIVAKSDIMNGGGYALLFSSTSRCVQKLWERGKGYLSGEKV